MLFLHLHHKAGRKKNLLAGVRIGLDLVHSGGQIYTHGEANGGQRTHRGDQASPRPDQRIWFSRLQVSQACVHAAMTVEMTSGLVLLGDDVTESRSAQTASG